MVKKGFQISAGLCLVIWMYFLYLAATGQQVFGGYAQKNTYLLEVLYYSLPICLTIYFLYAKRYIKKDTSFVNVLFILSLGMLLCFGIAVIMLIPIQFVVSIVFLIGVLPLTLISSENWEGLVFWFIGVVIAFAAFFFRD